MTTSQQTRTIEEAIAAIEALDLEPIKFKLMAPEGDDKWTQEQADINELGYRRYLTLLVKYPGEPLAPNKDVDKFWHGHILDTMKYAEDCHKIFGFFLHHFPYLGMRDEEDVVERIESAKIMDQLYMKEFGVSHYAPEHQLGAEIAYSATDGLAKKAAYSATDGIAKQVAYSATDGLAKQIAYSATDGLAKRVAYSATDGLAKQVAYSATDGLAKRVAYSATDGLAKRVAYSATDGLAKQVAYSATDGLAKQVAYSASNGMAKLGAADGAVRVEQDKMRTWFRPRAKAQA